MPEKRRRQFGERLTVQIRRIQAADFRPSALLRGLASRCSVRSG